MYFSFSALLAMFIFIQIILSNLPIFWGSASVRGDKVLQYLLFRHDENEIFHVWYQFDRMMFFREIHLFKQMKHPHIPLISTENECRNDNFRMMYKFEVLGTKDWIEAIVINGFPRILPYKHALYFNVNYWLLKLSSSSSQTFNVVIRCKKNNNSMIPE